MDNYIKYVYVNDINDELDIFKFEDLYKNKKDLKIKFK